MKKIFLILTLAILALTLTECKKSAFLDDKTTGLTQQTVFTDSTNTVAFLSRIYEDAPYDFIKNRWDNGSVEQGTDDSEYTLGSPQRRPNEVAQGTWTADTFLSTAPGTMVDFWTTPWTNIRRANLFLSQLPNAPITAPRKALMAAEARFLRAWFYHNLLINFGAVPIVGDKVYGADDPIALPRNTYAQCVKYISDELDACAQILPAVRAAEDYGRITSGACLALKSRLLLYAASPLYNGPSYYAATPAQAPLIGYGNYDVARWQAAADAAQAVMNTGNYSLFLGDGTLTGAGIGFYQVFLTRYATINGVSVPNSEYIFTYNRAPNRDFEGFYNPGSRGGSHLGMPTQNLVDCFPMQNGKAITDPTSGYNPNDPYTNREPRFKYSIIYNGAFYYLQSSGSKQPVFTYYTAPSDGYPNTLTGYYSRKMCDENISSNSSFNSPRGWPLIRYAEILLNYAEAINETGHPELAYPVLVQLRSRAGITAGTDNLYGMKAGMSIIEMRNFVQNERRIELMYEAQRWNDVRRWKIAMVTQNGFPNYMVVQKTGPTTFSYTVVNSVTPPPANPVITTTSKLHVFYPYDYLFPIPNYEIRLSPALIQNPGY